jgi:small subunit ribosomal protein S21
MTVKLRPGESQESLPKRFRKKVSKSRILSESRKKRWFVSKSEQRRIAKRKGIRKAREDDSVSAPVGDGDRQDILDTDVKRKRCNAEIKDPQGHSQAVQDHRAW